jgi:hypothetical protein
MHPIRENLGSFLKMHCFGHGKLQACAMETEKHVLQVHDG